MISDNSSMLHLYEPHVSVDSFTKEIIDDDNNIVYPVPIDLPNTVSTDLSMISLLDDDIYNEEILHPVLNDLPMLSRSLLYEEVLTTFYNPEELEQRNGLWCNSSPRDEVEMLSEEITYMKTSA